MGMDNNGTQTHIDTHSGQGLSGGPSTNVLEIRKCNRHHYSRPDIVREKQGRGWTLNNVATFSFSDIDSSCCLEGFPKLVTAQSCSTLYTSLYVALHKQSSLGSGRPERDVVRVSACTTNVLHALHVDTWASGISSDVEEDLEGRGGVVC